MNFDLVQSERLCHDRAVNPTANIIDSPSIKVAPFIEHDKGVDGGKKSMVANAILLQTH